MNKLVFLVLLILVASGCSERSRVDSRDALLEYAKNNSKTESVEGFVEEISLSRGLNKKTHQIVTLSDGNMYIINPDLKVGALKGMRIKLLLDTVGPYDNIDPAVAAIYAEAFVVKSVYVNNVPM